MSIHRQFEVTEHYGKSLRGRIDSFPVLMLRGSYEELGEAHGVLAGKEIIGLLDNILIPYTNKQQPNVWDNKVLPAASTFVFSERYENELNGILRGIKIKYPNKNDRMLFSIKREISVDDLRALNCFLDIMDLKDGCSSFSAWGPFTENGEVISGRNLDQKSIPGKIPFAVLAREPVEGNRQATIEISAPGSIGASTAMNKQGLIVMAHYESGLEASAAERWMPRAIVLRDAIEAAQAADSVNQIARIFRNRPVRLGNNTHITLPIHEYPNSPLPFVLEWDGNQLEGGVTVRTEDPSLVKDAIICTNHFVKRRSKEFAGSGSSQMRFQILSGSLQTFHASGTVVDVEKAIKMMDSVAENGEVVTYLTVIALPRERKMFFAISPKEGVSATKGEWIEMTWDQVFGAV